jgi:preprotein translocase subunit SecG
MKAKSLKRPRKKRPETKKTRIIIVIIIMLLIIVIGFFILSPTKSAPTPSTETIVSPWSSPVQISRGIYEQQRTCDPVDQCTTEKINLKRTTAWVSDKNGFEFELQNTQTGCKETRKMYSCIDQQSGRKIEDVHCVTTPDDKEVFSSLVRIECESNITWYIFALFFIVILGIGTYYYTKWNQEFRSRMAEKISDDFKQDTFEQDNRTEVIVHVLIPDLIADKTKYTYVPKYHVVNSDQIAALHVQAGEELRKLSRCQQILNESKQEWIPGVKGTEPTDTDWSTHQCSTRLCKLCFNKNSGLYTKNLNNMNQIIQGCLTINKQAELHPVE